ncbi:Uncharacterised protein [Mycobacteroides abscessus subsp. abscessus]|nr:Uncharacterised protein [Mycobacteroides abscessus subsp. abscessus]
MVIQSAKLRGRVYGGLAPAGVKPARAIDNDCCQHCRCSLAFSS